MTPKDWTLLVVAAAHGKAISPVQLQKTLFLLSQNLSATELQVDQLYHFEAYDYGPFDSAIYHDAEQLERDGMLVVDNAATRYRSYSATEEGLNRANRLRSNLDTKVIDYLDRVTTWVASLSFNQLVEAIYKAYPDMGKNSVFRR